LLGTDGDWVVIIVQIVLGVVFFAHGAQKALGWFGGTGLQSTVRVFREHLRIPAPLAVLAVAAEFLGGLGLIVGLLSRIAALGNAVVMIVALITVHGKFGFFMNWYGEKKAMELNTTSWFSLSRWQWRSREQEPSRWIKFRTSMSSLKMAPPSEPEP